MQKNIIKLGLYEEILKKIETEEINKELEEKIIYLSKRDKLIGIDGLKDLEEKTMEELQETVSCIEPISELIRANKRISGDEKKGKIIFNKSREIVTILADGKEQFFSAENGSHYGKLKAIYGKRLENGGKGGYEIACEVAGKLGDIVFVIESEALIMYFPKNITIQQKNKFKELMNKIKNPQNILWGASIIDGEDVFIVDFDEYSKETFVSDKFLGNYVNIIDENTPKQEAKSINETGR